MIVYSLTYTVSEETHTRWLSWMTQVHIPRIMRMGYFGRYTLQQLLDPIPENGCVYNLQFHGEAVGLQAFQQEDEEIYHGAHDQKFAGQVACFITVMDRSPLIQEIRS